MTNYLAKYLFFDLVVHISIEFHSFHREFLLIAATNYSVDRAKCTPSNLFLLIIGLTDFFLNYTFDRGNLNIDTKWRSILLVKWFAFFIISLTWI